MQEVVDQIDAVSEAILTELGATDELEDALIANYLS